MKKEADTANKWTSINKTASAIWSNISPLFALGVLLTTVGFVMHCMVEHDFSDMDDTVFDALLSKGNIADAGNILFYFSDFYPFI